VFIIRGRDKQNVIYLSNKIHNTKERTIDKHKSVINLKSMLDQKKADTKEYMLIWIHLFEIPEKSKLISQTCTPEKNNTLYVN